MCLPACVRDVWVGDVLACACVWHVVYVWWCVCRCGGSGVCCGVRGCVSVCVRETPEE